MKLFNKLSKWIKMKFNSEDKDEKDDSLEYKILVLGERLVGKSSICIRFTQNEFNLEIKPTTQSKCYAKSMKLFEQLIKIYIVDIDENVMSNDRSYLYSDVKGAFIVYDVTKSKTFEKVENWILDLRQNTSSNIPIVLCGNKSDLNFLRNVDYEEGLEKANNLNCEFIETSCIDLTSVKEAFKLIVAKIYFNDLPDSKKNYFKIYYQSGIDGNNNGKSDKINIEENRTTNGENLILKEENNEANQNVYKDKKETEEQI